MEKDLKISALVKDLGENREHLEATKNEEGWNLEIGFLAQSHRTFGLIPDRNFVLYFSQPFSVGANIL